MGWFDSKEELTTGDILVVIELDLDRNTDPWIEFTLDPRGVDQVRYNGRATCAQPVPAETQDQRMNRLISGTMTRVQEIIPSLKPETAKINFQIQGAVSFELLGTGRVQFLQSEWDAYKSAKASRQ